MSCKCDVCTSGDDPRYIGMVCREALKPRCPFCGAGRSDGMQLHELDCEWCTLLQRVQRLQDTQTYLIERLEYFLALTLKESNGSNESPDTQRSGVAVCLDLSTPDGWAEAERLGAVAHRAPELHPDSSPAESDCSQDARPYLAPRGPAGTEPDS